MNALHHRQHINVALFVSALLVMGTGLVLFTQFHIGHGAHAAAFAGLSKTFWRDLHRIGAILFVLFLTHHLHDQWRIVRGLLRRFGRARGQVALLVLGLVVASTGAVAWFALPHHAHGLAHARHVCVDVHNISALCLGVGAAVHTGRRWGRLWARPRVRNAAAGSAGTAPSGEGSH